MPRSKTTSNKVLSSRKEYIAHKQKNESLNLNQVTQSKEHKNNPQVEQQGWISWIASGFGFFGNQEKPQKPLINQEALNQKPLSRAEQRLNAKIEKLNNEKPQQPKVLTYEQKYQKAVEQHNKRELNSMGKKITKDQVVYTAFSTPTHNNPINYKGHERKITTVDMSCKLEI